MDPKKMNKTVHSAVQLDGSNLASEEVLLNLEKAKNTTTHNSTVLMVSVAQLEQRTEVRVSFLTFR